MLLLNLSSRLETLVNMDPAHSAVVCKLSNTTGDIWNWTKAVHREIITRICLQYVNSHLVLSLLCVWN